jgi:hypothetical protein
MDGDDGMSMSVSGAQQHQPSYVPWWCAGRICAGIMARLLKVKGYDAKRL